jgi:hypothetical protein
MQGLQALDQFKSFVSKIGGLGRYEDTYIVHAAEGETVVPMEVLDKNPVLKKRLFKTMMDMGIEPGRYIVGNELNSRNPVTGQPEFFLKKIGRRLRKAAADISGYAAPIVGAMYGPAAGAAVGGLLGQYKRENPGDPNQGMQMALRGGLSGIASNLAGGQGMFDSGLSGSGQFAKGFQGFKEMASSPFTEGGRGKLKDYLTTDGKSNIMNKFRELTDIGGGGSKLSIEEKAREIAKEQGGSYLDYLDQAKILVGDKSKSGFGGMSLRDLMLYGGLGTGILGKLIEGGQNKGTNAQIAKNRIDNTQIFDPETDVISYAAKGGVMDLQDGGESKGPGTGTSDSIPAMLSDGEFVMTAKAVRGAGGGDRREGARKMYEAMDRLEARA